MTTEVDEISSMRCKYRSLRPGSVGYKIHLVPRIYYCTPETIYIYATHDISSHSIVTPHPACSPSIHSSSTPLRIYALHRLISYSGEGNTITSLENVQYGAHSFLGSGAGLCRCLWCGSRNDVGHGGRHHVHCCAIRRRTNQPLQAQVQPGRHALTLHAGRGCQSDEYESRFGDVQGASLSHSTKEGNVLVQYSKRLAI